MIVDTVQVDEGGKDIWVEGPVCAKCRDIDIMGCLENYNQLFQWSSSQDFKA